MANQKEANEKKLETVTVAIDKDKGSQFALKWAVDNLLARGKNVTLLHINPKPSPIPSHVANSDEELMKTFKSPDNHSKEFFLPFRCFCTRKDIKVTEVIADEMDIAKAICDYVRLNLVETLILGAPTRNAFVRRFKSVDIPTTVTKSAAEFCTIYVISKGKATSVRSASACIPNKPPRAYSHNQISNIRNPLEQRVMQPNHSARGLDRSPFAACPSPTPSHFTDDLEIKSPFTRAKNSNKSYGELSVLPDTDISFVSSGRPSTDRMFASFGDDTGAAPRLSSSSDTESRISFGSSPFGGKPMDANHLLGSFCGSDAGSVSWSPAQDDVEAEMRRLKQELKQTIDMYSTACREALNAKQKATELHRWKMEEQRRLEEARLAEEAALAIAEKEKAKCRVAIEAAEAAQKLAEMEAQRRISAEMKAHKEAEERKKVMDSLAHNDVRYRKYGIDEIESATEFFATNRKIGEGGYGPVYRCYLDHTPVAIKVLRPDAAQGRSQFQQEVEVLSCIRHPNMVLLLGACPEYGCLVYEYMANGSLEDRLFRRGNTSVLPWQIRFRIAAEIGTGLLFLHQTKPEPLVHRDLKPGNILLDRNCVSKISDVGLARLVPPSVADTVTQYRMTSTAGTFCYIDPEYQQTGMLGTKSDIYSLGVMLLQIITAKPPMGLTHHVERAIEKGTFADMLDPEVKDWPVEEALKFAKLALKCAQMRKKDRPDLGKVVLPELNRLRTLAEETMPHYL